MPKTRVYFYAEDNGESPVFEWLKELRRDDRRAYMACRARVLMLAAIGHELRRPHADMLRDGIYELRAGVGRVNYRLLYFFHGKDIAVVAHGLTKEKGVPAGDIDRAIERRTQYEKAPTKHQAKINPDDL